MRGLRIVFLIAVLTVSSGFSFRCIFMCGDQTGVQSDYIEQRDHCRKYAQLKLDTETQAEADNKSHKAQLVTLFSECMARSGWTVPDGREGLPPGAVAAAPVSPTTPFGQATTRPAAAAVAPVAVPVAAAPVSHTAFLQRASECAFAHQAASSSANSAARAKACDLECAQRLRAMPEAPRPAACPAGANTASPYNNEEE